MVETSRPAVRNAEETKARIVEAAQQVFSEKAYSDAGLREIARRANVAVSLVIKHFSSKANLFEEALTRALIDPHIFYSDRSKFGDHMAATLSDRSLAMIQPAMIALSIGDDEAKGIIARVSQEIILKPTVDWLDAPDGEARANFIMLLTMGYVLFAHHIAPDLSASSRDETAALVAKGLQAVIDGAGKA